MINNENKGWRYTYKTTLAFAIAWPLIIIAIHSFSIINDIRVSHIGLYPLVFIVHLLVICSIALFSIHFISAAKCIKMSRVLWQVSGGVFILTAIALIFVWGVAY